MLHSCTNRAPASDHGVGAAAPRRKKWPIVDMHCHCLVQEAAALIRGAGRPPGPSYEQASELTKAINAETWAANLPKLTDPEVRLADMDRLGIDMQVISPSPAHFGYSAPAEPARDGARMVNDTIAELVARHPTRFAGMGTVPLQNPAMAEAELVRLVKKLGLRGVEISTHINGAELTRSGLDGFFARAEELGVVVFIHPAGTSIKERMGNHYFTNLVGHPLESSLAVGHLIFDGYLDRFSGLKICVAHGGGYLASYWGRFDHAFHHRADCRETVASPPSHYLRQLHFDSVVYTEEQLRGLIETWGAEHVLLGTDYPADMSEPDPVGFLERLAIPDAAKARVAGGNAIRLFGLDDRGIAA